MSFADLGLVPEVLRAVTDAGYTEPTPIQRQAIPVVLAGGDVMGGAQTGTGKTASFTLPLLHRLARHANSSTSPARHPVRALILAPTRELAMQVHESVQTYSKYLPLRSLCLYGGVDIKPQQAELKRGVEVVVATPGRLLDHVEQRSIQFSQVEFLVLDEADRMLDMGFIPDIRRILGMLPQTRQSLLFSATFSDEIKKLADTMLRQPQLIEVARRNAVNETITHLVHPVPTPIKRDLLAHLLKDDSLRQVLVFTSTKFGCSRLSSHLAREGITADAIHGDKNQQQRTEALERFKSGEIRVLVATDVAARGLDIDDLPCVVNFELPPNPEDYVHRIGRTGRAGKQGRAISLVAPEETPRLGAIEKLIKLSITQTVVAGFERDSDVARLHHRGESHGERPRRESAGGERRGRTERRDERSLDTAPRKSGYGAPAKQQMVAADGFDFSRPYHAEGSGDAAVTPTSAGRIAGKKAARPVAFLLGGSRK